MTPSHRASIAYWRAFLLGCAALGAVLVLVFMAMGRWYNNPLPRAFVAGPMIAIGGAGVIRLAERTRAKALRAGGSA